MNTRLLRRVRQHFVHDMAPRHTQRHNIAAWVRSVRMLGDKWVYAKNLAVQRQEK
jgi:hypothetical protein